MKKKKQEGAHVVIKSTDGKLLGWQNLQISVDGHVLENVWSLHLKAKAGQLCDVTIQFGAGLVEVQNAVIDKNSEDAGYLVRGAKTAGVAAIYDAPVEENEL